MFGVAAQFFYVGAQVGVWSFLIRYAQVAMPGTSARTGATYLTISLVLVHGRPVRRRGADEPDTAAGTSRGIRRDRRSAVPVRDGRCMARQA